MSPAACSSLIKSPVVNHVLGALPEDIFPKISPHLRPIYLPTNDPVYNCGEAIRWVYFPLDCVISSLAIMEDGATVEVCMAGREGIAGMSAIIGGGVASNWTRVQIAGNAVRMRANVLREMFVEFEPMQQLLLRTYRSLITQISQRSVCNCRHTLSQRLCCWLLMLHDRVDGDALPLTHELIAQRLGARRAGITTAACLLQSENVIRYSRGLIHILERRRLEELSCECYRIHKKEFESVGQLQLRTVKQAVSD
jgi:CRP-like cAMP-binding protein